MKINIRDFGARGNGEQDDFFAIQTAMWAANGRVLEIPAGKYRLSNCLVMAGARDQVTIEGEGSSIARFVADPGVNAMSLSFDQDGIHQPWGAEIRDVGFEANGLAGNALRIAHNVETQTSDHFGSSLKLRGVAVRGTDAGGYRNGIEIARSWNATLDDVYVSGCPYGGDYNKMTGAGIMFDELCVNAHLTNVRTNFWQTGIFSGSAKGNTEGMMCSNCSMVGVQRGVWIVGNPNVPAPRMSTLTWTGGMIECRVAGITGGSAAFHLDHVWTALIGHTQLLAESLPEHETYGLFLDNSHGVVVSGCDVNAWKNALWTTGECRGILSSGNTYTNCLRHNIFNEGSVGCRSYGHVRPQEDDLKDSTWSNVNKLGFKD